MIVRAFVGGVVFAAGTALAICSASAADLPVAPRPAPVAPVAYAPAAIYNWTGLYIGGHLGGGFGNSSWSDPVTGANNTFNTGAGFLGGAQVGGNLQLNMLVLGVEGDFSYARLKGSGTNTIGNTLNTNTNWTSTVTGRVGAAFDRLLVYGKGGVAFAQDQSGFSDLAGNSASTSFMRTGWTAGAGTRIRHHQKLVGQSRIRLSELRRADVEFHHANHASLHFEYRPQRPGSQGGHKLPLRRAVTH